MSIGECTKLKKVKENEIESYMPLIFSKKKSLQGINEAN
jgi:hypothetical protein